MSCGSSFSASRRKVVTKQDGAPHRETRLHAAEPGRLRAAAGVSGHTEVFGVDFTAGEQVVERTHRIPHEPCAEKFAD
jgi:hypothetical protein